MTSPSSSSSPSPTSKSMLLTIGLFHMVSFTNALNNLFPIQKPTTPPPIQKVAIIGSGISGLSLAHALENSPTCAKPYLDALEIQNKDSEGSGSSAFGVEACVYDSRPSLNFEAGAGVQINGGMSTLKKINPELQRATARASLPLKKIRSRTKPWFKQEKPFATLLELDIEKVIRETGGKTEKELIVDGEVMVYTIMRGALQEVLMNELPSETSSRVKFGKTLTNIRENNGGGIMCEFSDNSVEGPFDMVVGCDGINSAVKEYVERGKIINDDSSSRKPAAIYSGIRIQYAVQDGDYASDEPIPEESELVQYFGDGAYALAGTYGAGENRKPTKGAFVISRDEDYFGPFKKKRKDEETEIATNANEEESEAVENADWTQDVQSLGSEMSARVKESDVPNVQIGPIIDKSDRFFELGVYFHNPFSLSGWSREVKGSGGRYSVLAGDAAHAMPPFLGQGSNQAIQDSYCLASKIFQHNTNCLHAKNGESGVNSQIEQTLEEGEEEEKPLQLGALLKQYENTRWAPTASITLKAGILGYLETGEKGFLSGFRDAFFFVAGKIGLAKKVYLGAATPNDD